MSHKAQYFRDLVTAIRRQSPLILDNLGIGGDWHTLPGWPEYKFAVDVYYGVGRLDKFWAQWLRPRLRKHEHILIYQVYKERNMMMHEQARERFWDDVQEGKENDDAERQS